MKRKGKFSKALSGIYFFIYFNSLEKIEGHEKRYLSAIGAFYATEKTTRWKLKRKRNLSKPFRSTFVYILKASLDYYVFIKVLNVENISFIFTLFKPYIEKQFKIYIKKPYNYVIQKYNINKSCNYTVQNL